VLIVLASTSVYRKTLLERLGLPFETAAPRVDETPLPGEAPIALATRLAKAKAAEVASRYPRALVIGSDQVCSCNGQILGKPGNRDNAVKQLTLLSGRIAEFHTALCLVNSDTGTSRVELVSNPVTFRELNREAIERYLDKEPAYDCAGSAKSEGLGITLIKHLGGSDPNALVGLPLIALTELLRQEGVELP
jgi:septum formation protein